MKYTPNTGWGRGERDSFALVFFHGDVCAAQESQENVTKFTMIAVQSHM